MSIFKVIVDEHMSIIEVAEKMSNIELNNKISGIAIVVNKQEQVVATLTDGDIRKAIVNHISFEDSIKNICNYNPICVYKNENKKFMYLDIINQLNEKRKTKKDFNITQVVILNDDNTLHDVVMLSSLKDDDVFDKQIAVYGMGFVGLTLSLVMANNGLSVKGLDVSQKIVANLENNSPHFYENGLSPLLETLNEKKLISFSSDLENTKADIYVVAVGTPVDDTYNPNMDYINSVSHTISRHLKKGDLVVFRSTLPIGTMRNNVIPILEKSGLVAGSDFHVSFAPERTVEGKAIEEVQSLPQIIGGFTPKCAELTANMFREITNSIVEVDNLEASEMVKLLNNTYRDLVFSFANEVSFICDQYNINSFKLIEAANEGYPRNPIPKPSPGVGGICLSKDPHLYSNISDEEFYTPVLGKASRGINEKGGEYAFNKISKYAESINKKIEDLKIFIVGVAFKGIPATSDIRESMAVKLIDLLPVKNNVFVKDFVVEQDDIESLNVNYVEDLKDGFNDTDVVLFMNNHYLNDKFDMFKSFSDMTQGGLVFDGWNLFRANEVEKINGTVYSTMGYMTDI